jgi:hypothetical protein
MTFYNPAKESPFYQHEIISYLQVFLIAADRSKVHLFIEK